jgi:hypothetical protein
MLKRVHLHRTGSFLTRKGTLLALVILLALAASIQSLMLGYKTYGNDVRNYNHYNNYTMFERSFHHLQEQKDLYLLYPEEYWDLYKYTPSFTAFFGLFAMFPDWLGLSLWNLFNAVVLFLAIFYMPLLDQKRKGWVLLIIVIELMTALQNEQSNPLIAGLLLLSFGMLERKRYLPAAFFIVFSAFIKPFGLVAMALYLLYPEKWKMAASTAVSFLVMLSLPLVFVDISQYQLLIYRYLETLQSDQNVQLGLSVAGWLQAWFSAGISQNLVLLSGIVLFLVPFLLYRKYHLFSFRYLMLSSVLIWIVIFNYRAESPTYIIAFTGVALWFVHAGKNRLNEILFASAFIFTVLSPTDIFPRHIRNDFVVPYVLKAFPCIMIWFKIQYDLFALKGNITNESLISDSE